VAERSEPSFEDDSTQRTARTTASSSEPRANVHACFWMMRFVKDSLLHVEPKANFAIFCGPRIPQVQWRRYARPRRDLGGELLQLSTPELVSSM
jgi:hypothetical protein